jgi:hypothetical protein
MCDMCKANDDTPIYCMKCGEHLVCFDMSDGTQGDVDPAIVIEGLEDMFLCRDCAERELNPDWDDLYF